MASELDDGWRERWTALISERALRETEILVGHSSPSGDAEAGERAVALAAGMLPDGAVTERLSCSSPDHAPDLLARLPGSGTRRLLLVGHLDTVFPHGSHRPIERRGNVLYGSGTVDMKGGVAISLGLMHALAERPATFAEVALLLVNDEEFRTVPFAHGPRFEGFDACLCFEAGERNGDGEEAVVVSRKAASVIRVDARGVPAHSGANPEDGRSALLALAEVARRLDALQSPDGSEQLSVVPTIMRAGEGINVVPGAGELFADLRAADERSFEPVLAAIPAELGGVGLSAEVLRLWPGMDMNEAAAAPLARATELLGRPIRPAARGGASDASNLAPWVPIAIDGLGPLGAHSHSPEEHLLVDSLAPRTAVALALAAALLEP